MDKIRQKGRGVESRSGRTAGEALRFGPKIERNGSTYAAAE